MRIRHAAAATLLASTLAFAAGRPETRSAPPPRRLSITLTGRTVHNSTYLAAVMLYDLQTLLGARGELDVRKGGIVGREGTAMWVDLAPLPPRQADLLRRIAARTPPEDDLDLDEMAAHMEAGYYEVSRPWADLEALLRDQPFRTDPDWLAVPVDSVTFRRRRVLRIHRDRIADALAAYFLNDDRVLYPAGTVVVAESLDKEGRFVEAEVLRKRPDTYWDFAVYDEHGRIARRTVAFDEDGEPDPAGRAFQVPQTCAACHRIDRLDFSGDAESPVLAPIRGFFHRLPARVPEVHLGAEYYDHMAFTELTETHARVKDSVFGPYGSLLLSELAGRKRLGTLTASDERRYRRLSPLFPELLTPLERVDAVVNSLGMRLLRIPPPRPGARLGSPTSDPEHRPDETRHAPRVSGSLFMATCEVTNAQFRRHRPEHHSPPFRGVTLDDDEQPVAGVSYADALAFLGWLNALPAERAAGRSYRLPTEDEWEHAAKGGDDRRFPWGDAWPPPAESGNVSDEASGAALAGDGWEFLRGYRDGHAGSAPVGRFFPNGYLLHDMAGNVYEWTSSPYVAHHGGNAPGDLSAYDGRLRVARGSSWGDELPKVLRCAFRFPLEPATRMPFLGFRVVAEIPSLR